MAHRRSAGRGPDDAAVCYYLGLALARTGGLDEAIRRYRDAVRLVPGHPAAQRLEELRARLKSRSSTSGP